MIFIIRTLRQGRRSKEMLANLRTCQSANLKGRNILEDIGLDGFKVLKLILN
jgi:hypothetical protein